MIFLILMLLKLMPIIGRSLKGRRAQPDMASEGGELHVEAAPRAPVPAQPGTQRRPTSIWGPWCVLVYVWDSETSEQPEAATDADLSPEKV